MRLLGIGRVASSLPAAGLAMLLAGCGPTVVPVIDARPTPILLKEKLPFRVAVVMPADERDREHRQSLALWVWKYDMSVAPGAPLQEALTLSLTTAFDRVTVVAAPPRPGDHHLVLVPKITGTRWEATDHLSSRFAFSVGGVLRVLDRAGNELAAFEGAGRAEGLGAPHPETVPARSGDVASQAIRNLVKQWGEALAASPQVERYAEALRRTIVATTGASAGPPPSDVVISLSYPAEGARVTQESVSLVGVASAPKAIQRLELVVNGRSVPISRDVRVQATDVQSHPFTATIPLRSGENVIALTAIDTTGGAAQAVRRVFRETAQPAATAATGPGVGERWAVVIGIDRYQDPSIATLKYAAADAEAVFKFLTTRGGVKPTSARLLLNRQATQRTLRQVLGDFLRQKALRDDEVIIYYAGHGTTEADAGAEGGVAKYLVPWDADPASLFSTAIPMEEIDRIFGRISARKILLIQDTCFSGGAGGRTFLARGLAVRAGALTDRFLQELSQKEGRMILTASDVNQVSHEDPMLGHGIFTYHLLQALESGAADLDGDGAITVREVHLYLQRKVHEHARGTQTPQLYNVGDMVLVQRPR